MEQSYQVGSGNAPIILNVTVGTVGVAHSEFSIMKDFRVVGSGNSEPRSGGKIDHVALGKSDELKDSVVTIRIHIDFGHLSKEQRESAVDVFLRNNPPVSIEFSGGEDDIKKFSYNKEMDLLVVPNKKNIFITTQIDLI